MSLNKAKMSTLKDKIEAKAAEPAEEKDVPSVPAEEKVVPPKEKKTKKK